MIPLPNYLQTKHIQKSMKDIFTNNTRKNKAIKPKFKIHDLVRTAGLKKKFRKETQPIGLTSFMNSKKLFMIQHRVIK